MHKFISKVHAEQVMSEEFTARQSCNDRWLKLETRESLWREQALAVVQALLKEVKAQTVQEVGAQVGSLLYGAVAVEWAAVQQAATEKQHRLGELAVLAEQHVLVATRAEGGEVRHVQGDATEPQLEGAHNIVAHVCNDVGSFEAGFAAAVATRWKPAKEAYVEWHRQGEGAGFELGAHQLVEVQPMLEVANMVAQRGVWGSPGDPPLQYDALAKTLDAVGLHAAAKKATVHMPRIGAGLAMGDWARIEQMICRMAVKHRVLVVIYTLEEVVEQAAGAVQQGSSSMVIDEREDEVVVALQVQHENSGQWLDFERCVKHNVSTISVQAVRELGIKTLPIGGTAVLWVRAPEVEGGEKQLASFEVVEEDTPSIK